MSLKEQKRLQSELKTCTRQREEGKRMIEIAEDKIKETDLKLNGKSSSKFYGLNHMTRYTALTKYISNEYDICDDVIDLIYKELVKKKGIFQKPMNNNTTHRNFQQFIPRQGWISNCIRWTHNNQRDWSITDNRTLLDYQIEKLYPEYAIKSKGFIVYNVNYGPFTLPYIAYGRGNAGIQRIRCQTNIKEKYDKKELIALCEDNPRTKIKYRKSWTKDKLITLLLKED